MANCLYSGDKPLGIVQSNAEDVAYDSNTSVKEKIDETNNGKVIAHIDANAYGSIKLALNALKSYSDNLSDRDKLHSVILRNGIVKYSYQYNNIYACILTANNQLTLQTFTLDSSESTWYGVELKSGNTMVFNNNSSASQNQTLDLVVY